MDVRKAALRVLLVGFGLGGWLTVNAVYVQLPALVDSAPEGWTLASYLALLVQLGNLGPLASRWAPLTGRTIVLAAMCLNSVALLPVAFLHHVSVPLGGRPTSLPLFVGFFLLSLGCCTHSVFSWPLLHRYPEDALVPFLVGEGLSNLLPGLLSLARGSGPYNFSTTVFFLIIFALMCLSTGSFFALARYRTSFVSEVDLPASTTATPEATGGFEWKTWVFLPVALAVLTAFANGALPSVQSYSSRPYGKLAYALSVNLSYLANPGACLLAYLVPVASPFCFFPTLFLAVVFIVYVTTVAALSPSPPLRDSRYGVALNVITWICCTGFVTFSKLSIAAKLRNKGKKGMAWYGAMTQIGSSIGAIVMFLLTNYTNVFQSCNPC